MVLIVPEETERLEEPHRRWNELIYRQTDGRTDDHTGGRTDRRSDRQTFLTHQNDPNYFFF